MKTKILCVDDDPNILTGFQRSLRKQFNIETALGGEEALALLRQEEPYAVIVADMRMPGMDGVQFLAQARAIAPDSVRFMLTGNADQETAIEAVNKGNVFQFLTKPCPPEILACALESGIRQYHLVTAERELLEKTLNGSVRVLVDILSMADPQSFGMGQKLRDTTREFARFLKLENSWELELAAMLSQIGCVTVPPIVLHKHRAHFGLSGLEKDMIQRVPEVGARLIGNIPRLQAAANIVLHQNKNFDGSGFPIGPLDGAAIPLGARMLRILTDLYRLEAEGAARFRALEELRSRQGCYDPALIEAALDCFQGASRVASPSVSCAVRLRELRAGDVLMAGIECQDGLVIAGTGTLITPMVLEKLSNFAQLGGIKEPILVAVREELSKAA
jgi:response regulator RpfG family c-di-GMP phosphodiesterase